MVRCSNCGVVPHERVLRVRWFGSDLLVRIAERTTDSLWKSNLLTRIEEILTGEHFTGREFTEIALGDFLREQCTGESTARAHVVLLRRRRRGDGRLFFERRLLRASHRPQEIRDAERDDDLGDTIFQECLDVFRLTGEHEDVKLLVVGTQEGE